MDRAISDSVVGMVAEMNKEKFEESWALPFLCQLFARTTKVDVEQDCIAFDGAIFDSRSAKLSAMFHNDDDDKLSDSFLLSINRTGESPGEVARRNYATNGRFALYKIYGLFDAIHGQIQNGSRDLEILKRIISGDLLGDDPRFVSWRKRGITKGFNDFPAVELTFKDHFWYKETDWGRFLKAESDLLPKLFKEIEHRVEERRRGLAGIFSDG
jgi:hypothetical protein